MFRAQFFVGPRVILGFMPSSAKYFDTQENLFTREKEVGREYIVYNIFSPSLRLLSLMSLCS